MLAALLLAIGCSGAPDTGDPVDGYDEPLTFEMSAAFAYDPAADAAVAYGIDGAAAPLQPWIELSFVVEAPDGTLDECVVGINHLPEEGSIPRAAWAADLFGMDLPASAYVGGSCRGWDPAVWGDNPAATIAATGFGVGTAPLDAAVEPVLAAEIDAETWELHWQPHLLGGVFQPDFGPAYSFGYELDDAFNVAYEESDDLGLHDIIANAIPIRAEAVQPGQPLPRGLYVIEGLEPIDAALLTP